jgi:hypothetical protein
VLASVAGTLERVNKLVSVRPLRTKWAFSLVGAGSYTSRVYSDALYAQVPA